MQASIIKTAVLALLAMSAAPAMAMDLPSGIGGLLGAFGGSDSPAASRPASSTSAATIGSLSNTDRIAGLKDALRVGSERVVAQLGKTDGFLADPKIHIPLPASMRTVKSALDSAGLGSLMDDLELKMNRAAEAATPKAGKLFSDAVKSMTIDDAKKILDGPDDAATQYFKGKMSAPLAGEMQPIIDQALSQAGAVQVHDTVMSKYKSIPFMPDVKADMNRHVLDLGMQGIFQYMVAEEAAIRKDPAKRSTDILKKVFGAQ